MSIGNIDTAVQVPFNIPGMDAFIDDMQTRTRSAQNAWDVRHAVRAPPKQGVVAWVGYVTPTVGIDAGLGGYAARGAPQLITAVKRNPSSSV